MNTAQKQLCYYELRLRELLNTSFPQLAGNEEFIAQRADLAAKAYEDAFLAGNDIPECNRSGAKILFEGLYFSTFDTVFNVVCNEFDRLMPDEELHTFALKMLRVCEPVFTKYSLTYDFEDSPEYNLLYTELTGTIQNWIEEHGLW
jgi:hypothetical protein